MKANFYLLLLLFAGNTVLQAQNLITLQSGENATFYTNLDTTLFYAKNGDDIYLPGGYIKTNSETLIIDKAINIIGVGYNPYTNAATENTIIQCQNINIMPSVKGGSISGIYAKDGSLQIIEAVSNFTVSRCLFNRINIGSTSGTPSNISIYETVVENYIQGNVSENGTGSCPQNVLISNCIIGTWNDIGQPLRGNPYWENLTCRNCILYGYAGYYGTILLLNIQKSLFENCILIDANTWDRTSMPNNKFRNCMYNFLLESSTSMYDCIFENFNSIFVDPQNLNFNMKNDYRSQDNSSGKNAGTDGTDIGIYGGRFPWKDGGLPVNPHIESQSVSGTTDAYGNLNVKIKVEAQER